MAKRRCFSIDFYDSEDFLNLSNNAKALYLGLLLHADDEGVIINARTILRITGETERTLTELFSAGFLIDVDGVYIIKHWYLHNKVQPARMVSSLYQSQLEKLYVTQTKEYAFKEQFV